MEGPERMEKEAAAGEICFDAAEAGRAERADREIAGERRRLLPSKMRGRAELRRERIGASILLMMMKRGDKRLIGGDTVQRFDEERVSDRGQQDAFV